MCTRHICDTHTCIPHVSWETFIEWFDLTFGFTTKKLCEDNQGQWQVCGRLVEEWMGAKGRGGRGGEGICGDMPWM